MNRRRFLKWSLGAGCGAAALGGSYAFGEARWLGVERVALALPNLPAAFDGTTVAFVTDVHHGPLVPLNYVRHVVETVNVLAPDIVALGGDYVSKDRCFIAPCLAELGRLRGRLGRFAVLGNHDHWEGASETRDGLARAGISEVTNDGLWLCKGDSRVWICGVGDLWEDVQDLPGALGPTTRDDAVILLSHNPDYVEQINDARVGIVLSGHTHGGQVVIPGVHPSWAPTRYGPKYLQGLVRGPVSRVYVSRGVGTVGYPVRFRCRPEIVLMTLKRGSDAV